jgi:hypothetical protein
LCLHRFSLAAAGPGAVALVDLTQTLGAAGVANAMLVVKWES